MPQTTEQPKKRTKQLLLELPIDLYEKFCASPLRKECNSDAEGIRATIRHFITSDKLSQVNSQ